MTTNHKHGYTCGCGALHPFAPWVLTHWNDIITHECTHCGVVNSLKRGMILRTQRSSHTQLEEQR